MSPGCQSVAASGRKATEKKLVFRVDFQTRAMPAYQEVASRIHKGDIGKLITVYAEYQTNLMFEDRDAQLRKDPITRRCGCEPGESTVCCPEM
jgi:predicted dehydrogenase